MLKLEIPGWRDLTLEYLVLDYNGTLPITGELIPAVPDLFPGNHFSAFFFPEGESRITPIGPAFIVHRAGL